MNWVRPPQKEIDKAAKRARSRGGPALIHGTDVGVDAGGVLIPRFNDWLQRYVVKAKGAQ